MNIPDYQHDLNRKELERLKGLGFSFEITAHGYFVYFNGQGVGGASVLDTSKKYHWRHRAANLRDNLSSVIILAQRSKYYTEAVPRRAS